MAMTLQGAYDRLQQDILDDPTARRFTNARCFRALTDCLESCQQDMADASVRHFKTYEDLTTTAAGVLAFSSFTLVPLRIDKLAHRLNGTWQTLADAIDPTDHAVDISETIDVRVHFWPNIPGPTAATDTTDYLLGGAATVHANARQSIDEWVVYEAALRLRRLDASGQGESKLHELRNDARTRWLETPSGTRSTRRKRRRAPTYAVPIRWYQNNDELIFSR